LLKERKNIVIIEKGKGCPNKENKLTKTKDKQKLKQINASTYDF